MNDVEISIIIPAFNEAERLPETLRQLGGFLRDQPRAWEIVVSDDGSTDETGESCRGRIPGVEPRIVRASANYGKGHAVRLGMLEARGAIRVMCDADGSMPAEELPKLIDPLVRGRAHIAIGSRYIDGGHAQGQPFWRRAWSRLVNALVQRTLVPGIRDTHCGYKAFTAEAARDIFGRATVRGWAFDLEVLALALRLGHPVVEVPVIWVNDARSRVRPWRDLPRAVAETIGIRVNLERGKYQLSSQPVSCLEKFS